MILRYPKVLSPSVSRVPINIVDVFPTFFDLLNRSQLPNIHGESKLPYITGKKDPDTAFPYTFSCRISNNPKAEREILPEMAGHFMVRGEGFKYMVYSKLDKPDSRYSDEPFDILYDLNNDPGETVDLSGNPEYDNIKRKMNRVLQEWLVETDWKGKEVLSYQ